MPPLPFDPHSQTVAVSQHRRHLGHHTYPFTLGETETWSKKAHPAPPAIPCRVGLVLLPPDPQPNTLFPTLPSFETPLGKRLCLLFASCTKFRFCLVFQLCFSLLSPSCPLSSGSGYISNCESLSHRQAGKPLYELNALHLLSLKFQNCAV